MSNKFKPGDKVRCIRGYEPYGVIEGKVYTVARADPQSYFIDLENVLVLGWNHARFELVEAAKPKTSSFSSDVASFVADVEAGRIKRGGVPGKYRVFRNDDNNVVVEFFN